MTYYQKNSVTGDFTQVNSNYEMVNGIPSGTVTKSPPTQEKAAQLESLYSSVTGNLTGQMAIHQFISFDVQENNGGIFNYRTSSLEHKQVRF